MSVKKAIVAAIFAVACPTNKDRLRKRSEPQPYPLVEQARGEAEYLFIANNETGKVDLRASRKNRGRAETSPGRRFKKRCISA